MKSIAASLLVVIGIGLMVGTQYVGNTVSSEQEWSDAKLDEYSKLAGSVHTPAADRQTMARREQLGEMQQQLVDLRNAALARKKMMHRGGVLVCLLGIGLYLAVRMSTPPDQ